MIRTFYTHHIRKQQELTEKLWEFEALQGDFDRRTYHVATPSCWETYPDFSNYRGEGIYRKEFFAEGNLRFDFKGVSHTATVYLDGKEIASHYNAYTAFSVIVKNQERKKHILEIKADNRFSEKSALHIPNDYMAYGGISRSVVLEKLQDVFIENMQITPYQSENGWNVQIKVKILNVSDSAQRVDVKVSLAGHSYAWQKISVDVGEEKELSQTISYTEDDHITEWTMENPTLYKVKAFILENGQVIDDLIDRVGFREIKIEGTKILLNGKAIRIKGVCRHEDHPQFGCALPYAAIASDIAIIKDLGANSIRTSHYPNDEVFLDLCDEEGILVWEENHARGLSVEDMQNPNFEPQAEQVIREMIPQHYNHACIYIWGILNECASDSQYGKECYEKQFDLIKDLDVSRPRSSASCKFKTDICFGLPEVVSYNIYPLWYHETPVKDYLDDLYDWIQKETGGAGKPFLITEIGAGGIYGYRNSYGGKWTEKYQADTLKKQLEAVLEKPECSGVYIWQYCDIRISEEWFMTRPKTMNNKGIVDEYRRKKEACDVVKQIFESYSNYMEE